MDGTQLDQAQVSKLIQHRRFAEAQAHLNLVIQSNPSDASAFHLLGLVHAMQGFHAQAEPFLRKAFELSQNTALFGRNLGLCLQQQNKLDAALDVARHVQRIEPQNLANHLDVAKLIYRRGEIDEAVVALKQILKQAPPQARAAVAEINYILGVIFHETRRLGEAAEHLEQATSLRGDHAESWAHLGGTYVKLGEFEKAFTAFSRQLEKDANAAHAYAHLGHVSLHLKKYEAALEYYRKAAELRPDEPEHQFDIGNALNRMGEVYLAEKALLKCLERSPENVKARSTLASVLETQGDYAAAIKEYRAMLDFDVTPLEHSNYLYALHFEYPQEPIAQLELHRQYQERQLLDEKKVSVPLKLCNEETTKQRPLRIGFISPDFRKHSVAYFFEPLLEHLDRQKFDPFCYHVGWIQDSVTERFKQACNWCFAAPLTDEQLADKIRSDEIDILVDLAGHTGNNRTRVFTVRLAPVQISYLGYSGTTGLSEIDYLLTDANANPSCDAHHCNEELLYFPETYFCYRPPSSAPEPSEPPCEKGSKVTFGCFNNRRKVGHAVEDAWVEILKGTPDSRLIIKDIVYRNQRIKEETLRRFASKGIEVERVQVMDQVESTEEHLGLYSQIDIALDTFPYNGATTTCEALWMGVPVVSLIGTTHVGRMGQSILNSLALGELLAKDEREYIATAIKLAGDDDRMRTLRMSMRSRMRESTLMDEVGQSRAMQEIFEDLMIRHKL